MSQFLDCYRGKHEQCKREFQRFVIEGKKNQVTWLDEYIRCICTKRGCKCYVAVKDRSKVSKTRRKK